jgi:NAD(P)-dependent dehydrogenase (short-subunit alcohol dehydrogenase family)
MMLEGKTAVVTGIGPGMGRDIALGLAREGADVALVARSDKTVPAVAEEIEAMGRRAVAIYGNIADDEECRRVAGEVEAAFGGSLDILVNSAFYGGLDERFEEADLDKWQRPIKVNYLGTLRMTQALLPQLKAAGAEHGDARIVMVNTMSVHHLEAGAGA